MIAHDSTRGRTLMFGGQAYRGPFAPSQSLAETWAFGPNGYERLFPTVSPPAAFGGCMIHDSMRGRTVLCLPSSVQVGLCDTWEFDGANWRLVPVATPGPMPGVSGLAFDSLRGVCVSQVVGSSGPETWEFDGVNWVQRAPAVMPPARYGCSLVFDSSRGRIVMFGGLTAASVWLHDTWEYDGSTWLPMATVGAPSDRWNAPAIFDPVRNRVLLYGGQFGSLAFGDTWEYDGTNWTELPTVVQPTLVFGPHLVFDSGSQRPRLFEDWGDFSLRDYPLGTVYQFEQQIWVPLAGTSTPAPRARHRTVYDSRRDRTLLFGGRSSYALAVLYEDLWSYSAGAWSEITPVFGPTGRWSHGLAYDASRDRVVMFGGEDPSGFRGDTREFDGISWTSGSASGPSARGRMAMAYDPVQRLVVLFGGESPALQGDLWVHDANGWTQRSFANPPSPRAGHEMVYDDSLQRMVLFGGRSAGGLSNETWSLSASGWTPLATNGPPSPRSDHAMSYDTRRAAVLLHGGFGGQGTLGDTWQLRGATWTLVTTGALLRDRQFSAMVSNPRSGRTVLFGGAMSWVIFGQTAYSDLGDTWELVPPAVAESWPHGAGCPGSVGTPVLAAAQGSTPGLGATFQVEVGNVPANGLVLLAFGTEIAWSAGAALPRNLAPVGLPGCEQWLAIDGVQAAVASGGIATFGMLLPAVPGLAGTGFLLQGVSFDPAAPSGIGAVSNALVANAW